MLNQIILVGRLTHDIEVKILEDGRKVSDLTLAVQRPFKNMEGAYETDFIRCTAWEGLATAIESYCTKGVMVALKGRVQTWKYEVDEEKKLTMLDVIAERITYLSSPRHSDRAIEPKDDKNKS
jgi:single-strand DNA-binding protein